MASNYKVLDMPPKWISAHRDNEYKIQLPYTTANSGYNNGGFLKMNLTGAFVYPVAVGDRVYIPAGVGYTGYHTIKSIDSPTQITLNTTFAGGFGGAISVFQVTLPEVSIYKGYKVGEIIITYDGGTVDLSTIQPYTLVATVKPEAGLDGFVTFNFCGYAKGVIEAPYKPAYNPDEDNYLYKFLGGLIVYTPKYYNKIRLLINGGVIGEHFAANASISTAELNQNFVDTQRSLSPLLQPTVVMNEVIVTNTISDSLIFAIVL